MKPLPLPARPGRGAEAACLRHAPEQETHGEAHEKVGGLAQAARDFVDAPNAAEIGKRNQEGGFVFCLPENAT